jgi:pimeloyl-ACP methyl ester carboxylesterase
MTTRPIAGVCGRSRPGVAVDGLRGRSDHSAMPSTRANGITIEYDTFGAKSASPLLLVMGLGAQMIAWDERLCSLLADRGHYVVRYDNRDTGLSSKIEGVDSMGVAEAMAAAAEQKPLRSAYLLKDMAADGMGLLDAIGVDRAHIVGASMGGMIVQEMVINFPRRILTMTSIMSTTGGPGLPQAKPEAMAALTRPAATTREEAIEGAVASTKVVGSPGYPADEAKVRERAARAYDRQFYPAGFARQLVAVLASGSRREGLSSVKTPTLVIHGAADPLVPVEGGKDTAASIAGSELLLFEGMGHDLPEALWPEFVGAISRHTSRVAAPK